MNWYYMKSPSKINNKHIIAVSDTGMMMRHSGSIEVIPYRQMVTDDGKLIRAYRLIAKIWLKAGRHDQTDIDHITHNPKDMNINDVRNLRWCTKAENCQFDEHCRNLSNAKKGKPTWNKGKKGVQAAWNKGLSGDEYLSHYSLGRTYNSQLDAPKDGNKWFL